MTKEAPGITDEMIFEAGWEGTGAEVPLGYTAASADFVAGVIKLYELELEAIGFIALTALTAYIVSKHIYETGKEKLGIKPAKNTSSKM
jgi:hypothetical protein